MMMSKLAKIIVLGALCGMLTACDAPQVYGSVGVSSFGGYHGSSRMSGSVRIGGRIY